MSSASTELIKSLLVDGYSISKVASGDSMLPTIPAEAVLNIEPVTNSPMLGDVVLILLEDGSTKIHRVSLIYRRNGAVRVQTWGDNCQVPDASVSLNKVLGRVVSFKADDGWSPLKNRWKSYIKFFLLRYGLYYLKKIVKQGSKPIS